MPVNGLDVVECKCVAVLLLGFIGILVLGPVLFSRPAVCAETRCTVSSCVQNAMRVNDLRGIVTGPSSTGHINRCLWKVCAGL